MSLMFIDSDTLSDIADAIRTKKGTSNEMTPLDMPGEIASIPTPTGSGEAYEYNSGTSHYFGEVTKTVTIQNSGTLYVMVGENYSSQRSTMTVNGISVSATQSDYNYIGFTYFTTPIQGGDEVAVTFYGNGGGSTGYRMLIAVG